MSETTPFEPMSNGEVYQPSSAFIDKANVQDWESKTIQAAQDLQGFWSERALELEWYQPWNKVLDDSNKPFYKWFTGGKVNIVHNCLDRYVPGAGINSLLSGKVNPATSVPSPIMR